MALTKTPICDFGKKAENFNLKSTENKMISLNDVKGENGTLIMFICNHCPYVLAVIKEIVKDAEGFVYSVNVEGQTGVRSANIDRVNSQIERIKKYTKIPVVSGFGIKNEEDVKIFSKSKADGIVLGSAIVKEIQKKINEIGDKHIVANFIRDYCKKLIKNLNK